MLSLTKGQKKHVAKVLLTKRKEMFGYPGGSRDLAERVGVSPQLLSMWTRNKRFPGHTELLILAEVFGMPLSELCCLNKRHKQGVRSSVKGSEFEVTPDDARNSMLEICTITTQIVERQRQMLTGKRNYATHTEWLKRIRNFVDAVL